ncbi:hypothetical protein CROQUDRAFT_671980 [Cronartium quercuum f. sp. fusiforme G11]|uniref:Uncharacterized protein n=1 Tax=Cronartium quercuum f. sp. fusiforme G11 TaxID=708437 RepID=A0A9P6NE34_9BASI|nr:hypothetical protein CROQUDRAFT_671980 [Cronartium quercuum f. sp. fusiforme G11]
MLCLRNLVFCALFLTLVIDQSFAAPSGTAPAHYYSIRDLRSLEPRRNNAEDEGDITMNSNEKTAGTDQVQAESVDHDNENKKKKRSDDLESEWKEEKDILEKEDHMVTEKSVETNEGKSVEAKSTEKPSQVEEQAEESGRQSKNAERMRKRSKSVGTGNKAVAKRGIEGCTTEGIPDPSTTTNPMMSNRS